MKHPYGMNCILFWKLVTRLCMYLPFVILSLLFSYCCYYCNSWKKIHFSLAVHLVTHFLVSFFTLLPTRDEVIGQTSMVNFYYRMFIVLEKNWFRICLCASGRPLSVWPSGSNSFSSVLVLSLSFGRFKCGRLNKVTSKPCKGTFGSIYFFNKQLENRF